MSGYLPRRGRVWWTGGQGQGGVTGEAFAKAEVQRNMGVGNCKHFRKLET